MIFTEKCDLNKHILAVHPKCYNCVVSDKVFKPSVELELLLITHDLAKQFKYDVCEKSFHMKWRLEKHKVQNELEHLNAVITAIMTDAVAMKS